MPAGTIDRDCSDDLIIVCILSGQAFDPHGASSGPRRLNHMYAALTLTSVRVLQGASMRTAWEWGSR